MFADSQSTLHRKREDHSLPVQPQYQQAPQHSSTLSLPSITSPSHPDAILNLPVSHHGAGIATPGAAARQASPPAPRPSQNRAAFGKWKSKAISGFPAMDVPLPSGLTAQEICESFPNHVNDHVILALMREGKGAKAIDALMPAPAGKQKAGQSHSKIQLRISTVREAFPNENFPITSTKRNRARSEGLKDEEMSFEDDSTVVMTANDVSSLSYETVGDLSTRRLQREEEKHHHSAGIPKASQHNSPLTLSGHETSSDQAVLASSHWSPSRRQDPPLLLVAKGPAASWTSQLPQAGSHDGQTPQLEIQIRDEHEKHQVLVFGVYYGSLALYPPEMRQTILAHCADRYDALSRELQGISGVALKKAIMPSGQSEHPLSYLRRSITQCFETLPEFRARVDFDCPADQIGKRLGIAILRYLLDCLYEWTRQLEEKQEIAKQIRNHKNLHARHSAVGRVRTTASWGMQMETSLPASDGSKTVQPYETLASFKPPQENEPEMSTQLPQNSAPEQRFSQQPEKQASNVSGRVDPSRSDPVSRLEDQAMVDTINQALENPKHGFEMYMEQVEQFVNRQSRAIDLPTVSGKLPTISSL